MNQVEGEMQKNKIEMNENNLREIMEKEGGRQRIMRGNLTGIQDFQTAIEIRMK